MTKKLFLIFLLIGKLNFSGYGQFVCSEFTITGTSSGPYFLPNSTICRNSPLPLGRVCWTYSVSNGFLKHTFNTPQSDVSIWYTCVNNNDFGTITVNGGGVISLSVVSGCANLSGNIVGPYTGGGPYGDILVNVKSSLPFTDITLVNTGGQSGFCSGDCNSVIINSINPCNIKLGNDTILCQGENMILDATTTNANYLWQDNSTSPTFNITQQGKYWVEVTVNNCTASDTIIVDYSPMPIANLGNDTILCQGENMLLDATTTNANYLWQDNSTSSTFNITQQGKYWVELTVNNCSAADTIQIEIQNCEVVFELPNLVTPNGDGKNDLFVPINIKGIESINTSIYNRWGAKIYESNKHNIDWNSKDMPDGIYYWLVQYTDIYGNAKSLNGIVTSIK